MPRQQPLEHRHRPGLERLRQQGVVGVRKHPRRDVPAVGPRHAVLVDQQPHQLGNCHRRVRVIELNRNRIGDGCQRAPLAQMRRQDVLKAGADEKILLLEPQLLALRRRIIRIQHARQVLCVHLFPHRAGIVAGIESVDVKRGDGAAGPEPQVIDGRTAVAGNQLIETDCVDVAGIDPAARPGLALCGTLRLHAAAEADRETHAAARHLPDIAQAQPAAGHLALTAVAAHDLREYSVIVANAVAHGGIVQRGQGIQVTCRQPAQAAVAQPRVDFLGSDLIQVIAHVAQRGARFLQQVAFQARQRVDQGSAGKIFDREVAHAFHVGIRHAALRGKPAQRQLLAHREGQRIVDIPGRRRVQVLAERSSESDPAERPAECRAAERRSGGWKTGYQSSSCYGLL